MKIILKCGEVYDFHKIKDYKENNGIITIVGNFKPHGKYKEVKIFEQSIFKRIFNA